MDGCSEPGVAPVRRAGVPQRPVEGLRLRPPRHRVEPVAVYWWTARALLSATPPVLALVVGALLVPAARAWLLVAAAATVAVAVPYVLVMPRWRYRVHRWEVTDDAVYTISGWLRQEARVAPLSRVQTVDTRCGPLQRLFGLTGIIVTTASSIGPVRIEGLTENVAAELVDQLTAVHRAGDHRGRPLRVLPDP